MGTSTTTYIGLIYGLSILIASVSSMGSAFLANRIYPLKGGDEPPPPTAAEVAAAVKKAEKADTDASKLADKLAASDTSVPQPPAQVVEEEEKKTQPAIDDKEEETPPAIEDKEEPETPPPALEDKPETPPVPEDPNRTAYINQLQQTLNFPSKEDAKDALDILETPRGYLSKIPNIKNKLIKLLKFLKTDSKATTNVLGMLQLVLIKTDPKQSPGSNDFQIMNDLYRLIPPAVGEGDA